MKQNNGKISVLVFKRLSYSDQHLHYNYHHQTSCNNCAVSSLIDRTYSIIANNDDLNKENSWIKQVLKEKGYQEGFISKIFARIAIMVCLSQNSKHKPQRSKKNPGPKPNSGQKFSLCHWNLNSIPGHNFSKIQLLSACNSLNVFVIIFLPETYLDFSILPQDPNVEMQGYLLIRTEHPSSFKTRGSLHLLQKPYSLETF